MAEMPSRPFFFCPVQATSAPKTMDEALAISYWQGTHHPTREELP